MYDSSAAVVFQIENIVLLNHFPESLGNCEYLILPDSSLLSAIGFVFGGEQYWPNSLPTLHLFPAGNVLFPCRLHVKKKKSAVAPFSKPPLSCCRLIVVRRPRPASSSAVCPTSCVVAASSWRGFRPVRWGCGSGVWTGRCWFRAGRWVFACLCCNTKTTVFHVIPQWHPVVVVFIRQQLIVILIWTCWDILSKKSVPSNLNFKLQDTEDVIIGGHHLVVSIVEVCLAVVCHQGKGPIPIPVLTPDLAHPQNQVFRAVST